MVIPVLELGLIATERLENGILKKINKIDRTDIKETRKGLRENKKRYKSESKKKNTNRNQETKVFLNSF